MAANSPTPRKRAPRKTASTPATDARVAEALREGVTFTFGGHEYTTPPSSEWSIDVLEALDDQRHTHVVRELLGDEQWAAFRGRHNRMSEFNDFLNAALKAAGSPNS